MIRDRRARKDAAARQVQRQDRRSARPGSRSRTTRSTTSSPRRAPWSRRIGPVTIVDTSEKKKLELRIEVPVEDMAKIGQPEEIPSGPASQGPKRHSIWTAIHPRLLELVRAHRSTLIFVNSRRIAERLGVRAQRARRRDARPLAPWIARAAAAHRGRGSAQGRAHPRPGRHLVARARHRHGRDRPRRPDRGAAVGGERHAAHRPRRPHDRRRQPRDHRAEVPRRSRRVRRGDARDARVAHRVEPLPPQPARRPRAADRRHGGDGRVGRRRALRRGPPRRAVRRA